MQIYHLIYLVLKVAWMYIILRFFFVGIFFPFRVFIHWIIYNLVCAGIFCSTLQFEIIKHCILIQALWYKTVIPATLEAKGGGADIHEFKTKIGKYSKVLSQKSKTLNRALDTAQW